MSEIFINQQQYLAEQTYLGCMLYEPELAKEAKATAEMFTAPEHRTIMHEMMEIVKADKPLDPATLMIRMYENGSHDFITHVKGHGYITELAASVPTVTNFHFYGKKLIDAYKVREAKRHAKNLLELEAGDEAEATVFETITKIQNVMESGTTKKSNLKDILVKVYDRIEGGGSRGVPSGFVEYDRMTLGFHATDLSIVAARPSVGKTAFALNVAVNQAEEWDNERGDHKNHLHIFSLEMPEVQLVQRMVGMFGRINAQNMRMGELSDEEWRKITQSMGFFSNLDNLDIHDQASITVPEIRAIVQAEKRRHPHRNHIVLIDYLQLIGYHGKSNENQAVKVGEISKSLKVMAKELNVNVTALSQLSRGVETRQDKRPIMSDIRESGSIEQDADNITFLYRDDYYDRDSENKNMIELIVAKQRNGPTGTVEVAFVKEYGLFVNVERRMDYAAQG